MRLEAVGNFEDVRYVRFVIGDFEIEPLIVRSRLVNVRRKDQLVVVRTNLKLGNSSYLYVQTSQMQ